MSSDDNTSAYHICGLCPSKFDEHDFIKSDIYESEKCISLDIFVKEKLKECMYIDKSSNVIMFSFFSERSTLHNYLLFCQTLIS